MDAHTARYAVQRQDAEGADWYPLASCNSLDYARMIAAVGFRRQIGAGYRVIHVGTGKELSLSRAYARRAGVR